MSIYVVQYIWDTQSFNLKYNNYYLTSVSVSGIITTDISGIRTSVNFYIGAPLVTTTWCEKVLL